VLSDILSSFIANANQLLIIKQLPLSKPIAFAESWEEQGSAREIRMRPTKGRGAGPNYYGGIGTELNGMVRKVWTTVEIQCWGLPDPTGNLLKNTDDTERLRQVVVVAMNQATPGGYRYVSESWNHPGEVSMYGRCLTMMFELEQPIADIQPYLTEATIEAITLTATESA
jgi:hypothetical protein